MSARARAKQPATSYPNGGRAIIERRSIVIRVPLATLPMVVEGAWAAGGFDLRFRITNVEEFAADLVRALNSESEDGTTPIHTMFDKCILDAIGQGAFGIEEHEEQDR